MTMHNKALVLNGQTPGAPGWVLTIAASAAGAWLAPLAASYGALPYAKMKLCDAPEALLHLSHLGLRGNQAYLVWEED